MFGARVGHNYKPLDKCYGIPTRTPQTSGSCPGITYWNTTEALTANYPNRTEHHTPYQHSPVQPNADLQSTTHG